MARVQVATYEKPSKSKRPGVHAKSKSSSLKTSKNYKKNIKDKEDETNLFTNSMGYKR